MLVCVGPPDIIVKGRDSAPSTLTVWILSMQNKWDRQLVLAIAIALSFVLIPAHVLAERPPVMPENAPLDYRDAFRYTAAWASSVHADIAALTRSPHEFHGTLGSLDFAYSEQDHVLHAWSFVMPGAGPFVTTRPEIKETLDQIAHQHPEQTDGAVFEIATLDWNRRASANLEPCLRLRLDIRDHTMPVPEMVNRLTHFSTTGYLWNREKMLKILDDYWKAHPKPAR